MQLYVWGVMRSMDEEFLYLPKRVKIDVLKYMIMKCIYKGLGECLQGEQEGMSVLDSNGNNS